MSAAGDQRRRLMGIIAAVAALGIAGCGGGPQAADAPVDIEEQLGLSQSGAGAVERQARVENGIRDCMRAQGFEYTPVDPLARQQALTGKARLSDEEFVRQLGYGVSTLFGRGSPGSDPNERIRRRLPAADRAAYDRALWGDHRGVTFLEALDTGDFTELGGCTKRAGEAAFGGGAVLGAVVARLDELDQRIVQDQRMVRAVGRWAACMRAVGHRFDESDQIDEELLRRLRAIVGAAVRPGATGPPGPGASWDPAALAELKRYELEVAAADRACEQREVAAVEHVVRTQHEYDFRRENRRLLLRVPPAGG